MGDIIATIYLAGAAFFAVMTWRDNHMHGTHASGLGVGLLWPLIVVYVASIWLCDPFSRKG